MNEENEEIDLLDNWDAIPDHVKEILVKYNPSDMTYENCANLVKELNTVGYTIDYYLNAIPFNLQKL